MDTETVIKEISRNTLVVLKFHMVKITWLVMTLLLTMDSLPADTLIKTILITQQEDSSNMEEI